RAPDSCDSAGGLLLHPQAVRPPGPANLDRPLPGVAASAGAGQPGTGAAAPASEPTLAAGAAHACRVSARGPLPAGLPSRGRLPRLLPPTGREPDRVRRRQLRARTLGLHVDDDHAHTVVHPSRTPR